MTNELFSNERISTNEESLFQKFFSSTGRIDRMTFLGRSMIIAVIEFPLLFAVAFVGALADLSLANQPLWIDAAFVAVITVSLIPEYFLDTKRLHDIGKDETLAKIFFGFGILTAVVSFSSIGALLLISNVLGISSLIFKLYLLFKRGESNNNEYGAAQ